MGDEKNIVGRAAQFAFIAHGFQLRKWTDEPYFVHLVGVADLLRRAGCDDRTVAVGYLHDTIEDTGTVRGTLATHFDPEIGDDVVALTNEPVTPGINRAARKVIDTARLAGASDRAQTVKCADLLNNGESIIACDKKFAAVFVGEAIQIIKVLDRAHAELRVELLKALARWDEELTRGA